MREGSRDPKWEPWNTFALFDVMSERRQQVEKHGFTTREDDGQIGGQLSNAAAFFITGNPSLWPWGSACDHSANYRQNMVKAAALLMAEIERLDRLADQPPASKYETHDGEA